MSDRAKELACALAGDPWLKTGTKIALQYLLQRWDAEDRKAVQTKPLPAPESPEDEYDRYF